VRHRTGSGCGAVSRHARSSLQTYTSSLTSCTAAHWILLYCGSLRGNLRNLRGAVQCQVVVVLLSQYRQALHPVGWQMYFRITFLVGNLWTWLKHKRYGNVYIYIYIYIYMCVCVFWGFSSGDYSNLGVLDCVTMYSSKWISMFPSIWKKHCRKGEEAGNGSIFSQFHFSSCDMKQYQVPEKSHPSRLCNYTYACTPAPALLGLHKVPNIKIWHGRLRHWISHLKAREGGVPVHFTSAVVAQSCGVAAVVCTLTVEHAVTPWTNRAQWLSTQCLETTWLGAHRTLSLRPE
jgi:hypothetical protein